jgi:hypothetical protein
MIDIKFLQIKPNSDNNISNLLKENCYKIASTDNFDDISDLKDDVIELFDDIIINHSNNDPILMINSFFASINGRDISEQNYDTLIFNKTNNKYNIILVNTLYNSTKNNLSDTERTEQFNLLASILIQSTTNNNVIFGDAFIININCSFYDSLLNQKTDNENYVNIYYNYTINDLINSYTDVLYVRIFVKSINGSNNNFIIYNREILDKFLQTSEIIQVGNDIIKITHNDKYLFIKTTDFLPNSHNSIMTMINDEVNNNNFYLTNLLNDDYEILEKL